MSLTSWLQSLRMGAGSGVRFFGIGRRNRLLRRHAGTANFEKSNTRPLSAQAAECLEARVLPTVAALLIGTELNVVTDGADSITVRTNAALQVEILANGVTLNTAPTVNASAVTTLRVTGGDAANVIDLSGVTAAQFTLLPNIVVNGNDGNDTLTGSPDLPSTLLGGDGTDVLIGGSANDSLDGGNGADVITGGLGNDTLVGANGADTLNGGAGLDFLDGGDGPDSLNGGDGDDSVLGGNGADNIDGGLGNDTLNGDGGNDTVTGNAGNDLILGGANNDLLLGGDGNDTLNGQGGNDTVHGEAGDDLLFGDSGADSLLGGAGQDVLNGGSENDTLVGGADNDSLLGGAGHDRLFGDELTPTPTSVGNDVLNGQSGNDTLEGGGGNDALDGGTGNDLLQPNTVDLSTTALLLSIDDTSVVEGDSGITNVAVTVRLSQSSIAPVTVDYATQDDTALAGADYQAVSGRLVFAPGQTTRTITVPVRGDVLDEADERLFVRLSNAQGAMLSDAQAAVTIVDNDVSPNLPRITIEDVVVSSEGNGIAALNFGSETRYHVGDFSVDVLAEDFDGDGDLDLAATSTGVTGGIGPSILFNAGDATFPVVVNTLSTGMLDLVSGDLDGDGDADLLGLNSTTGIASSNTPILGVNDGGGAFAFQILLPSTFGSVVDLADVDADGDLDIVSALPGSAVFVQINLGSLNFAPTVMYPVTTTFTRAITTGDFDGDGDIDIVTGQDSGSISVLFNAGNGTFGTPVTTAVTGGVDGLEPVDFDNDGDTDLVYSVPRAFGAPNGTIGLLRNNGLGAFSVVANQSFPGNSFTLADIDNDGDADLFVGRLNGMMDVWLNDGTGAFTNLTSINLLSFPYSLRLADLDSDGMLDLAFTRGIDDLIVRQNLTPDAAQATFTVNLSSPSASVVTVDFATASGSAVSGTDFVAIPSGTVTFQPGQTSQTVTVEILGDVLDEPNENFFVNLSNPTNATIGDSQGHATIVDDDGGVIPAATLSISDVTQAEGNAGATNFVFNVSLIRPAGNNSVVTVQFATADDAATSGGPQPDYVAANGTLTFAASVTTQTITVTVNGDVFIEPDESFFVNLLNPVGALLTDSRAVGLILDDDGGVPTPLVLVDDVLVVETDSGSVSAVVTVTLSLPAPAAVTINLSTADGSARAGTDYIATTTTINIPIGGTSGTASILVLGDTRAELAEFFTVNLLSATNALLTATSLQVTILDDDSATFSSPNDCLLIGGEGNDTANGGLGNDTINGGAGADLLSGGTGNDSILGGSSADTISGGDGHDTLSGQGGNDLIDGGNGDDQLIWNGASDGNDTLSGTVGFDMVSVVGTGASDSFAIGQAIVGEEVIPRITVTSGGATLVVSNIIHLVLNGNGGDDAITIGSLHQVGGALLTINGGDGNDSLSAAGALLGAVRMRINGDAGNDTLTGSAERDTLDGGDGDDLLSGGTGNDLLLGGLGNDVLNGNDGNDSLLGGDGDDALRGNAGNDSITGGLGNDNILGGDGADTVAGDAGADTINGEAGNDSLSGGTGADTIFGGDGADTLDGGMFNDSLSGGAGDDFIHGGEGDDTLDGGDGNDSLLGGDGADLLLGGAGNDAINGGHGNDVVNGGAGNDTLLGSDGNDTLRGGAGNDVLLGGDGDDNLDGQGGADTIAGNEGVDTLNNTLGDLINETFALPAALLTALEA